MNFFVHGLMYSYYAAKTLQIKMPKYLPMAITTLQLSQMVVGVYINLYSLWMKSNRRNCFDRSYDAMYLALSMYATYFILFANFFVKAYFTNRRNGSAAAKAMKVN